MELTRFAPFLDCRTTVDTGGFGFSWASCNERAILPVIDRGALLLCRDDEAPQNIGRAPLLLVSQLTKESSLLVGEPRAGDGCEFHGCASLNLLTL